MKERGTKGKKSVCLATHSCVGFCLVGWLVFGCAGSSWGHRGSLIAAMHVGSWGFPSGTSGKDSPG